MKFDRKTRKREYRIENNNVSPALVVFYNECFKERVMIKILLLC